METEQLGLEALRRRFVNGAGDLPDRSSQPHQAATKLDLGLPGFVFAHREVGGEGVELAAGIGGVGPGADEAGIAKSDEVLQDGIQASAHVPGAAGGRVRLTVRQHLQHPTPHRISEQREDEVPVPLDGIGRDGGGATAPGHESESARPAPQLASLEISPLSVLAPPCLATTSFQAESSPEARTESSAEEPESPRWRMKSAIGTPESPR